MTSKTFVKSVCCLSFCCFLVACEKKFDPAQGAPPQTQTVTTGDMSLVSVDKPDQFPIVNADQMKSLAEEALLDANHAGKRPDLLIDGPLQYDAAFMPDVAKTKAPNSLVAGRATVFIFPDLNTGNTTYKAVQRSANVISIGPMLQGLKRPVNDLSRGALVDDIVYTIALTAVQATQ